MAATYQWKQPMGGLAIVWTPLTVGKLMDCEAQYRSEANRHLLKYAKYMGRIVSIDGKAGCELGSFRDWEEADLEAFADEVETVEYTRRAASRKGEGGTAAKLEAAIGDARLAFLSLNTALDEAMVAAKAAEVETADPLK